MPSLVTHQLFAYDALKQSNEHTLLSIVDRYHEAFSIGSSGPDFLLFYRFWPLGATAMSKKINDLGDRYHREHINAVFAKAFQIAKESQAHHEETISFLAGWLCHYALDRNAHPFIFYWSGFGSKATTYSHRRMEAMIDALMIKHKLNQDIASYHPQDILLRSPRVHTSISRLFTPISKDFFHVNLSSHTILSCLKHMRLSYAFLHDPKGKKFPVLQKLESIPYQFTGTLIKRVFSDRDEEYDVLNLKQQTWVHPCDDRMVFHDTFFDVYDKGVLDAAHLLSLLTQFLEGETDLSSVMNYINNRTYDTGRANTFKMIHSSNKYAV